MTIKLLRVIIYAAVVHLLAVQAVEVNMSSVGPIQVCQMLSPSPRLEMFVDSLPKIPRIHLPSKTPFEIGAYKITQKLHRDLPPTTLYAYGTSLEAATYPGPTLVANADQEVIVRWTNHIPDLNHILPVDPTIERANPRLGGVPIVTHLHGMEDESFYDGNPDAWYTQFGEKGPAYLTEEYHYPNAMEPALLWYHDHTFGLTRLNMVAGLVGTYVVKSAAENLSPLPKGLYEVVLVLQDKQFFSDGSINFPNIGNAADVHPIWCAEYLGDTILVNGKAWPFMDVFPFKYRFRLVNAANNRFFLLSLNHPNMSFIKIGTDGGLLPHPVVQQQIRIAPAERVDFIIDFSGLPPGTAMVLRNSAPAPFPNGVARLTPESARAVMQFRIVSPPLAVKDNSLIPTILGPEAPFIREDFASRRVHLLEARNTSSNEPYTLLLNNRTYRDPATEIVRIGSIEIWDMINLTPVAHSMHIHLIKFHVSDQQPFSISRFTNRTCSLAFPYPDPRSCFTGPRKPPDVDQIGWKDTAVTFPGFVTRFLLRFTTQTGLPFPFNPTIGPGYVWHCHLVDHEDNSMMRPLLVRF
ncbi:hypothetical protein O6H91_19G076700 [Diphasiastrum complanatum]|uniref:Uncharacterized protein n=3 Tax=Diphasiastrum complanatum TaxID=34168 RepID=A0ACC2AWN0_DIPCM|nr:hypothetical protein O6H91_Y345800 [Diphasiastrum complanatum]KAJ7521957.1 hypothetical protein O6H91_19G076700 [Diphasiastrum complanatum]KAJ7521958.1 hypothetical protein O6H91_19G076700 [Diphasiastrum complanatum]